MNNRAKLEHRSRALSFVWRFGKTLLGPVLIAGLIFAGSQALEIGLFNMMIAGRTKTGELSDLLKWRQTMALGIAVSSFLAALILTYLFLRKFRSRQTSSSAALLLGLGIMGALTWTWQDVQAHWQAYETGKRPLKAIKSWYYHLGKIDVDKIARSRADLLVIDYARNDGKIPLTSDEVAKVAAHPDGGKRPVLAYLSIGEAESYRFYWKPEWARNKPVWHLAENCAWPRNHLVRFWHKDWKRIIYAGAGSYLKRIIDAGFDGVYLDRVDVYGEVLRERPNARTDMIDFVIELAKQARRLKPGFVVIVQNAEDLLNDRRYRHAIDGLGKEDLLYGQEATGERNPLFLIWRSAALIRKLQWEFKPVFAVEYLTTKKAITNAALEMRARGLIPTFAHRDLDGSDPTKPHPVSQEIYGTPEWIARECEAKNRRYW